MRQPGEPFDEVLTDVLFSQNTYSLFWPGGSRMPDSLVDDIVAAMSAPGVAASASVQAPPPAVVIDPAFGNTQSARPLRSGHANEPAL